MSKNREIIIAIALSFLPAYILYLSIYSLAHNSAIIPGGSNFIGYRFFNVNNMGSVAGMKLKLWALLYLAVYLSMIYFASFPRDPKFRTYFFSIKGVSLLSKTTASIWIICSLVYLVIILFLGQTLNPW